MFFGNANRAVCVSLMESSTLHQPRRRNLYLAVVSRKFWRRSSLPRRSRHFLILPLLNYWILEERPCAAAIFIIRHDQHGLAAANLAHGIACLLQRRDFILRQLLFKIFL